MIGSVCIDVSLENIWRSWWQFRKGKKWSQELHEFQYHLEQNLYELFIDLHSEVYSHGDYKKFTVMDNKKREISVAHIRDRVVHRLLYDYLTKIYDKTFIYDAWSCRAGKGLLGAIERVQKFLYVHRNDFIWRADVKKFFDSVHQETLLKILAREIHDSKAMNLLIEIVVSFERERDGVQEKGHGIAIGNLTSQIFANIYLNELDRYVKYILKPKAYLRYGDDFIVIDGSERLNRIRSLTEKFLNEELKLRLHSKNNLIVKPQNGLKFLGVVFYPKFHQLNKRNRKRILMKLNLKNMGSYLGIAKKYGDKKLLKEMSWKLNLNI